MSPDSLSTVVAGGSALHPLAANSLFEDVVVGVVVAILVFALYYRFILRPAKNKNRKKTPSSKGDTGN